MSTPNLLSISWPQEEITATDTVIATAAKAIRTYYFRNLPLLRQIPYLMLEANGRGGWLDTYSRAYFHCQYPIHKESLGYDLFLELRTGLILSPSSREFIYFPTLPDPIRIGGRDRFGIATDVEVFHKLAHQDPQYRFDPYLLTQSLQEEIKQPYHNDPNYVAKAIKRKEQTKLELDEFVAELPLEIVLATLRQQEFEV